MKMIAAVDEKWGIGKDGGLLFSIPEDMKFFRAQTQGKTVIMGYKTLLSLPGSKPLKNRQNIVLSRKPELTIEGATVVHSVNELLALVSDRESPIDPDDVMIIGGASIYNAFLPFCSEALITKISADGNADTFIQNLDLLENWSVSDCSEKKEHEGLVYQFVTYKNSLV